MSLSASGDISTPFYVSADSNYTPYTEASTCRTSLPSSPHPTLPTSPLTTPPSPNHSTTSTAVASPMLSTEPSTAPSTQHSSPCRRPMRSSPSHPSALWLPAFDNSTDTIPILDSDTIFDTVTVTETVPTAVPATILDILSNTVTATDTPTAHSKTNTVPATDTVIDAIPDTVSVPGPDPMNTIDFIPISDSEKQNEDQINSNTVQSQEHLETTIESIQPLQSPKNEKIIIYPKEVEIETPKLTPLILIQTEKVNVTIIEEKPLIPIPYKKGNYGYNVPSVVNGYNFTKNENGNYEITKILTDITKKKEKKEKIKGEITEKEKKEKKENTSELTTFEIKMKKKAGLERKEVFRQALEARAGVGMRSEFTLTSIPEHVLKLTSKY